MGIDWIWVGYEGKRAGFSKMEGKTYAELFRDLHAHGITVNASMIIGFDYQTPEIIWEEFDELMRLRPSICQFLIYGPTYGTPLHERMKQEGRLLPIMEKDYARQDGFSLGFEHPHINPADMEALQRNLYRHEFERLGPSVFRVVDDYLAGYNTLKNHPAPRVRAKAEKLREKAHRALMLLPGAKHFVNSATAVRLQTLQQGLGEATGKMTPLENAKSKMVPAAMSLTAMKLKLGLGNQPPMTRKVFRQPNN